MATPGQFEAKKIRRLYNGEVREVWRAVWVDQFGVQRTKDNRAWQRKGDALGYARDMAIQVHGGVFVADRAGATFADATKLFLEQCEERHQPPRRSMSTKHLVQCQWAVDRHLVPQFGRLKMAQMQSLPELVEQWTRQLEIAGKLNNNTIGGIVNVMKRVLDVALRQKWLGHHPLREVKLQLPTRHRPRVPVPEDADVAEIINALMYRAAGQSEIVWTNLRMLVHLIAFAGLRIGEAAALHWEDIDFERFEIWQHRTRKTPASERYIRMLPLLHAELDDHRQRMSDLDPRQTSKALAALEAARTQAAAGTGRVLRNRYGDPWTPNAMGEDWRMLRARVQRANPEAAEHSLYSLRHYAGSVWLRGGMPLHQVSAAMGHTDSRFTERTYIRILKEADEESRRIVQQVGEGQLARFRRLGLEVRATAIPVPELAVPHRVNGETAAPAALAAPIAAAAPI